MPERSPFPNFGRIQLVDNGGNGNYHSLGTKLTKRYSNGLTALMSYTYRQVDRHRHGHPQPRRRHAVPAEQLLPRLRTRPLEP